MLFAPHFLGLDAGATRLSMEIEAVSVYSRQKDAYVNGLLERYRTRFKPSRCSRARTASARAIREMRRGLPFYYLPDQDFGPRDSVFVPFFGVPAATITGLSRVAQLAGAAVVPVVTRHAARRRGLRSCGSTRRGRISRPTTRSRTRGA